MAVTFLRLSDDLQRPCRIAVAHERGVWGGVHPLADVMGSQSIADSSLTPVSILGVFVSFRAV